MSSTLPLQVPWSHHFCNRVFHHIMAIPAFSVSCLQVHEELAPLAISTEVINSTVCSGMESRLLDVRNSTHCHLVMTPLWAHIFPSESQPPTPVLCLTKWKSGAVRGIRGPWFLKLNRVFSSCFFDYLNQNHPGHL